MAVSKQNISISFSKGLDTKTDPNQVLVGDLVSLQNCIFNTGKEFAKRNGYQKLASLPSSGALACSTFKSELIGFNSANIYSYSPALQEEINKGTLVGVELNTTTVYRSANAQKVQDSAYNSAGLYLYVWIDSINGAQYMVVSSATGNQIISATSLVSTAVFPRAWSIGNYLVVTYVDTSSYHLRYITIPVNSLVPSSPNDLSTVVNSSNPNYDGILFNNNLYFSFNGSDLGNAIRTTYLDSQLNQHNTVVQSGESASSCITMFGDAINNQLYIAYANGTQVKYFVLNSSIQSVLPPTVADSSETAVLNIVGYAASGTANLYYQIQNTYSYSTTRSDYIKTVSVTSSGNVGSVSVFLRSVGIISKTFAYNSMFYFWVAYNGSLQPTYFLVNQLGSIIAKAAYTNGGGYTAQASITTVNQLSNTQFQFAYLFKDLLETQSGQVYTQTGVNSLTFNFNTQNLYQTTEAGNNLNITGGYLYAYDGYGPIEHNFHVFPEDMNYSATSGTTGIFANTYGYSATYEWVDNQGNTFRSVPSEPLLVVVTGPTSGISINIPTLRLTAKQNTRSPVNIVLYRTAPSFATNVYYRVSSILSPTLNNTSIDSVQITDTANDGEIIGNQLLYTTGGVIEDTGAPAAIGTTLYKNRVFLITAEDRNTLWYSKQTLESTPVEMNDSFTLYIDPRFGVMTAISVMDDKLIIFKANAIFYFTGEGPDNTGANNDFSEPVFITSIVGCSNPNSIVLTQNGLMFQSNKGIWLLDRGLNVSYIGAPVQAYNSATITSANIIPSTTQVRFTLNTGICLVYDYFYNIWGTFTNHYAAGGVIFNSLFTYLSTGGVFLQENPGVYTDNGEPFYISLQTGWLSLSGLQGYQRAYKLYLLGNFISPHILNVSVAYDFNSAITQNAVIQPTSLANLNYGNDPFYGSTQYYGGNASREQYRVNFVKQKCQSIQITLTEGTDTTNPVYGASFTLSAMGLVVGTKLTYPKLPPTQSVT